MKTNRARGHEYEGMWRTSLNIYSSRLTHQTTAKNPATCHTQQYNIHIHTSQCQHTVTGKMYTKQVRQKWNVSTLSRHTQTCISVTKWTTVVYVTSRTEYNVECTVNLTMIRPYYKIAMERIRMLKTLSPQRAEIATDSVSTSNSCWWLRWLRGSSSKMSTWLTPEERQPYVLRPSKKMNKMMRNMPR